MLNPENYTLASEIFLRLLGLIYFFVFFPYIFQILGLIGRDGILPIQRYLTFIKSRLGRRSYYLVPNIFWINSGDKALMGAIIAGILFALLLCLHICPPLMLLLLFIIQLSIVTVGQDFLSFGWEMFLLELTFNSFFLSLTPTPNLFIWISLNLLLFRFHFQGGAVKLQSRDQNWRNLTACSYHYQTQPLPNTIAWYMHKLPLGFQKISTAFMFFAELAVPFFIIADEITRFAVFIILFGLQYFIWLTGNLSYLNHLTAVSCLILLSNTFLAPLFGDPPPSAPTPLALDIALGLVGIVMIVLQLMNLWNHFFQPKRIFQRILSILSPYHIVNRYGIFAVMTTKRYEIIIEGSNDGKEWKEYLFYYKPSEISRRPRRISPYQPRLDWQAWFLPFTSYESEAWFQNFLAKLLEGSSQHVLRLLRHNPFPDKPPVFIRAVAYDYVFTDWKTKRETGYWWKRTYVGLYAPVMRLRPPKKV